MNGSRLGLFPLLLAAGLSARLATGSDFDELKIDREAVFEFVQKPALKRSGDRVVIVFEVKGRCDVTVAIENADGRILRHLASGVLGGNAPAPFQKNALKQTLAWDGKDDRGAYVDDKDTVTVRISLGLKPQLEKTLLWSPQKRIGARAPLMVAAPEGVYVFDGLGVEHLRLFDHDGNYVRTVYPFPAGQLDKVVGLPQQTYAFDGRVLPLKGGFQQASLLPSGTSAMIAEKYWGGIAATAMAVHDGKIALAYRTLARLSADGSSGGLPLQGQAVSFTKRVLNADQVIGPNSMAFSPDGKYLYLTGYHWGCGAPVEAGSWHGVYRMEYARDDPPQVFAGEMTEDGHGSDERHFTVPTCVATDRAGRVYVADYLNDRVQIFSPEGKVLKSVPASKPAWIAVHQETGDLFVFSWPVSGISNELFKTLQRRDGPDAVRLWQGATAKTLMQYGPFEKPEKKATYALPEGKPDFGGIFLMLAPPFRAEVDSWSKGPRLWMAPNKHKATAFEVQQWGRGMLSAERLAWSSNGIRLFDVPKQELAEVRDFSAEVEKQFTRSSPPDFGRQRLYFNPADRKLYVAEDSGFGKSFKDLLQVDPESGEVKRVDLPFDCEDLCFDQEGLAYLRTDKDVLRFNFQTWREVPWDYGEERDKVFFNTMGGWKACSALAALPTPGHRPVQWHMGGMHISPKGHLVVSTCSSAEAKAAQRGVKRGEAIEGKPYSPQLYPGRVRYGEVHVWDKHGKLLYEDAIPGLTLLCGVCIDKDDNLYALADSTRAFDGKKYVNEMTGTLMKFVPKKGRIVSASGRAPVPLPPENAPKGPPDVDGGKTGKAWVEGAEWMFGAAGWFGFNTEKAGGGCDCWHSRFCLDYLDRSFVPEVERYSVAALDANGNVITRLGRCGNVDDGQPLVPDGGPPSPRSIGGDEISLFHAAYVGTETDRRLFVHDAGNARILSVKLNYHAEEKIALKDVKDAGGE